MTKTRQRFNSYIFILACFIASAWFQSSAGAETYYVAKTGNDGNSCAKAQNQATPKKTINVGIECLASGDTLIIKGGTYDKSFDNRMNPLGPPSGTDSAYTTIKAAPGETVWVRPSHYSGLPANTSLHIFSIADGRHHIKIERINIDGSGLPNDGVHGSNLLWSGDRTNHLIFDGMEMKLSRGDGIHLRPSSYGNILRNSYIHDILPSGGDDSPAGGLYLRGPKLAEVPIPNATLANTPGNLIENNRFENLCCGNAIGQRGAEVNNTIRGNVFTDINAYIMLIGTQALNTSFYNNVINRAKECLNFGHGNGTSPTTKVYNNTFYNTGNGPYKCFPQKGYGNIPSDQAAVVKNNIFYQVTVNGTLPASNFIGDPKFVNPAQDNFKLQEGSPAIDKGITLNEVPDDIEGNKRPAGGGYDIGAYEFHSGGNQPVSVLQPPNLRVEKIN
jgi:hypothetical protein